MAKKPRKSGPYPPTLPREGGGSAAAANGLEVATAANDIDICRGYLGRLENPDPTLRTEAAGKGLTLYDEVDRDAHAGSVLQTRYLAVTGREWRVDPADDSPRAAAIAAMVQEALRATNFDQFRQEMLQAILYGFYPAEVIWQVKRGLIVPHVIRAKHPRRFCFDQERRLRLLTPANPVRGEELPERKFLCFTYGSSDNPYGKGVGSRLWWPVWFKKVGIKFWLIFLDKFGVPTGVGKYPASATKEEKATLLEAVASIQSETGVIIPDSMAIALLEATRGGAVSHEGLCEYMDRQISKSVLGQTATTEGTAGKLGNDDAQSDVRDDIIKADADLLCECLNNSLVRWIVDLNFGPQDDYPELWIRTEDEGDLKPLAERDKILVQEIGLPVGEQYFYDTYGIPAPEQGEALVSPSRGGETRGGETPPLHQPGQFAEPVGAGSPRPVSPRPGSPGPSTVSRGVDHLAREADAPAGALIDKALSLLDASATVTEFRDQLLDLWDGKDTEALGLAIARASWLANLSGRLDAQRGE